MQLLLQEWPALAQHLLAAAVRRLLQTLSAAPGEEEEDEEGGLTKSARVTALMAWVEHLVGLPEGSVALGDRAGLAAAVARSYLTALRAVDPRRDPPTARLELLRSLAHLLSPPGSAAWSAGRAAGRDLVSRHAAWALSGAHKRGAAAAVLSGASKRPRVHEAAEALLREAEVAREKQVG